MKRTGKPVFFVVLVLILALVYLTFTGVYTMNGDLKQTHIKSAEDIRWGIDIRGGVDVTFTPPADYSTTGEQREVELAAAKSIIEVRMMSQGITDYESYIDYNKARIIVRFPWKEDEADFNAEKAIQELGETAVLTFREGMNVDENGLPTGVTQENIILEGLDVVRAEVGFQEDANRTVQTVVSLRLSDEGAAKFAEATSRLVGQPISIWMDDTLISAPNVNSAITDGNAVITGNFSGEEAKDLADKINAGALPFKLETANYNTISPTLGAGAKNAMIMAGIIAFALIAIFMLVLYRVPGLVAVITLTGQVTLIIASITGFFGEFPSFTLTLPGIAGIILSIGYGVDATVITAERIKEEINKGKTIDGAIESGYKRAFSAIVDGNVTVVIVALILMGAFGPTDSILGRVFSKIFFMFGPATAGNIYSFGYTLLMGVIFNLVMGVGVSRLLLKSISKFGPMRKPELYGGKSREFKVDFSKNAFRFFSISGALIVVILVCNFAMGAQLDIQFRGGSMITYGYEGDIDQAAFQSSIEEHLGSGVNLQQATDIASGIDTLIVSLPGNQSLSAEELVSATEALQGEFSDNNIRSLEITNVNPTIGREFLAKSFSALALAIVLMLLYVAFRFRKIGGLSAGAMGVVALLHDCIVVFGVFIIFRLPIDSNFIAVILTILGYSLNDTIVIYDRIRENQKLYGKKKKVSELVNLSINQSLTRTINTSVTTIMSMIVVTIVAVVFGVDSIFSFSFPLIIGLISGSYSSICLAGPLWVKWQERKTDKKMLA